MMLEALYATIAGRNAGGSVWTTRPRGLAPGCDADSAMNQARGSIAGPISWFGKGEWSVVGTVAEKRCKAGSWLNHPPSRIKRRSRRRMHLGGCSTDQGRRVRWFGQQQATADTMQGAQVDEHIDQRVEIGNRATVAEAGTLDAKFPGLAVDAFGGRALTIDALEVVAGAVEFMADAVAWAGGEGGDAATLLPVGMMERTDGVWGVCADKRTAKAGSFMGDQAMVFLPEGGLEGHGQRCGAERQTLWREGLPVVSAVGPGNSSKPTGSR